MESFYYWAKNPIEQSNLKIFKASRPFYITDNGGLAWRIQANVHPEGA
jgi:hypothetical protein